MAHPTIAADALYQVRTICPNCEEPSIVMVRLDAVLTTTRSEAFLSVKASPKKLEHSCDESDAQFPFDPETGEVLS